MKSAASAEQALFYADASALVKLVTEESESEALRNYIENANIVSCELALTEIPRAIRRIAADDPQLLDTLLAQADELIGALALVPLDQSLLLAAGALSEPFLRALDAIHVAAATDVSPIDAFISYDERQGAAARLAGLRTVSPAPDTSIEGIRRRLGTEQLASDEFESHCGDLPTDDEG